MALAFSATVGAAATANNGNVTPARPAGMTNGNICICFAGARGAGTLSCATSGWNTVGSFPHGDGGNGGAPCIILVFCVVTGSESDPTITYSGGSAGDDVIGQCAEVTGGADTTTPVIQVTSFYDGGNTQNIGSITAKTITNNNLALAIGFKQDDWTSVATLTTANGYTWTELGEPKTTTGNDAGLVWDWSLNNQGSNVSTGAKTFSITGGASNFATGVIVEIQVQQAAVTLLNLMTTGMGN